VTTTQHNTAKFSGCVFETRLGGAKDMWKYILGTILLLIGILEIVLALHGGLREALMQTSPVRLKEAESSAFLLAGISALVMGVGLLFFGLFW
jgi:hypothetical protein